MFGKRAKPGQSKPAPASTQPACTCPTTWTEQQQQVFGTLPVKFSDCPRHD